MTEQDLNSYKQDDSNSYSLRDIVDMILGNWIWFAVSVAICLAAAAYYVKSTPYVYSRSATMLINSRQGGGMSEAAMFSELKSFSSMAAANVDTEMAVLQSKRLMMDVVRDLHLDVSYNSKQGMRPVSLYTNSPYTVQFVNATEEQECALTITAKSGDTFELSDFVNFYHVPVEQTVEASVNDTVSTPIGQILVTRTPYFNASYVDHPVRVVKSSVESTAGAYKGKVEVSMVSKMASIIKVSILDSNPKRGEDILNALMAAYQNYAIEGKTRVADNTAMFIEDRLVLLSRELGNVDKEIVSFKRDNQLLDVQSEASLNSTEALKYKTESINIETQMNLVDYMRDIILNMDETQLVPMISIQSGIDEQIGKYNDAVLRRDKLLSNSSHKNPAIIELENMLASMRQSILSSLDQLKTSLKISLGSMKREEQFSKNRISDAPIQESKIQSIERQLKVKEELYLFLLNKREENALARAIIDSNARVVDEAYGPAAPVSPNKSTILLAALLLGCAIPLCVIFVIRMLDTSVHSRKDIEDNLSIPMLGDVPMYEGKTDNHIAVKEHGRDSVSEAFRMIRSNMSFMGVDGEKAQVILVTSSNEGAGKTFVSTNLAMSLAMTEKRVLLVDFDLRKRTLTKDLKGRHNPNGLSRYLSDSTADLRSMIQKGMLHPNMDVILAGLQPPNPAEMLLSGRLDDMMAELRKMYDYIVLDSVPAMLVADAIVCDRLCDLAIYVVREGLLDRRQLPDIERLYQEKKFRKMALILNGVRRYRRGGYYGYGYGYGSYGYGYGMSEDKDENSLWKRIVRKIKLKRNRD